MLNEYVEFNIVRFIKESKRWDDILAKLYDELAEIPEIKAMSDDTPVQTSGTSDRTAQLTIERDPIIKKIKKYEYYKAVLTDGLAHISQPEREVLNIFFFGTPKSVHRLIDDYAVVNHLSRSEIYKKRRLALEHLSEYITTMYPISRLQRG